MTIRKTQLDGLAISLLLGCCLFWALQQILVKATMAELAPAFQASLRFFGASVLVLLWCRFKGISLFARDGTLKAGLLAGVLFAGEFACLYIGLQQGAASRLTLFLYTSPFWVATLLPLFVPTERLRASQWIGLVCAFMALVFALSGNLSAGQSSWWPDLLGLAAGMMWGLTTVVIRASKLAQCGAEKLLFYQLAVSALCLPFLSLALGEPWVWRMSGMAIGSLFLQTVVGAFASYLVWMWMLGRYPAAKMSAFVFLTPVFTLVFAALWLGEPITAPLVASLCLVAVGIFLVNRR